MKDIQMIEKESEAQRNQVPCSVRVANLRWTSCFPRGTVVVSVKVSEQREWDVQGLICIYS